jgi:hypothetical protein
MNDQPIEERAERLEGWQLYFRVVLKVAEPTVPRCANHLSNAHLVAVKEHGACAKQAQKRPREHRKKPHIQRDRGDAEVIEHLC